MNEPFWKGRRVFVTGHTGFKGSWLCIWLHALGARITGYALAPPTQPSLFELSEIARDMASCQGDVRDRTRLGQALSEAAAEVVFHLAAQPLVRDSYQRPVDTFETNVMGTVNLLEAVRQCASVRAVVNVTTDKCYDNLERNHAYQEEDRLGGYDPYSASKACSELVTAAYRSSYFNGENRQGHPAALATARAGNVIGGGDWAADRLVPDCIRALASGQKILIRNPTAVRPWQHVLEPLRGYLMLAEKLCSQNPHFAGPWNFGPNQRDIVSVEQLVGLVCRKWGGGSFQVDRGAHVHEAGLLQLNCAKARTKLGWAPVWDLERSVESVVAWAKGLEAKAQARRLCLQEIDGYGRDVRLTSTQTR